LETDTPIDLESLTEEEKKLACHNVTGYQLQRIRLEFQKDEEYKEYSDVISMPNGVFAPYFYIPPDYEIALENFLEFSRITADVQSEVSVYAVLCASSELLNEEKFTKKVVSRLPETGVNGVWLWFSAFDELDANEDSLMNFINLVQELSGNGLEVYNRHGGFFSLMLHKRGMTGISHSIGYGEKKDVLQIKGPPNAPIVQYYLPDLRKRYSVDSIERCLYDLDVTTPEKFYENICDCVICKGVVKDSVMDFSKFGEMHYARYDSVRETQTPSAAKRCRYHFLMNRIKEKEFVCENDLDQIRSCLEDAQTKWEDQYLVFQSSRHMKRWIKAIS
jgi:hypothetical protein